VNPHEIRMNHFLVVVGFFCFSSLKVNQEVCW
jgi:hypothetical protein